MPGGVVVGAGGLRHAGVGVEQPILDHPVRIVAVGALDVAIRRRALAQQRGRLDEVLAALGSGAGANVVHFAAGLLIGRLDRHAARQREIVLDVRHAGDAGQGALGEAGVALVAGFLDSRCPAGLGRGGAVGALP